MYNDSKILIFALLSVIFICGYLNIPIAEYGNKNTDPGFVTVGDTVTVNLPLIEAGGVWQRLRRINAIPLFDNSDSVFWGDQILDIEYEIIIDESTARRDPILYQSGRGGKRFLSNEDFKQRSKGPYGDRLITLVIPNDERLIGQALGFDIWFLDDDNPHRILFRISNEEDRSTYLFWRISHVLSLIFAIVSVAIVVGTILGLTGAARRVMSDKLSTK
jgi:hypothetical protein